LQIQSRVHLQPDHGRTTVAVDTVSSLIFSGPLMWTTDAACVGQTDLFFAPAGERPETRLLREARARAVCSACPAVDPCRRWAREQREYGFWGGESEEERAAAGFRVDMPVGRVARYPKGNGEPVTPRETRVA
jgi:WhiB family redox-sensing transcriptional regulator